MHNGESLALEHRGATAILTIHRPAAHNAINQAMWADLSARLAEVSANPAVRVVLLRGAGGTFSAGADVRELAGMAVPQVNQAFRFMLATVQQLEDLPQVTIACITGVAAGIALDMALACDLQVLSGSVQIGMPILRLGITPQPELLRRLVATVGPARARALLLKGGFYSAPAAFELGIGTEIVPDPDFDSRCLALADQIAEYASESTRATKRAIQMAQYPVPPTPPDLPRDYVEDTEFHARLAMVLGPRRSRRPSTGT